MSPRVPSKIQGIDVFSLPLSTLEGFVLSLVDGAMSVDDISVMSGIDGAKLQAILARLSELGALDLSWIPKPKPAAKPKPPSMPPDAHFAAARPRYAPAELDEDVAIVVATRKRVLDAFYAIEGRNHYELLGVPRRRRQKGHPQRLLRAIEGLSSRRVLRQTAR